MIRATHTRHVSHCRTQHLVMDAHMWLHTRPYTNIELQVYQSHQHIFCHVLSHSRPNHKVLMVDHRISHTAFCAKYTYMDGPLCIPGTLCVQTTACHLPETTISKDGHAQTTRPHAFQACSRMQGRAASVSWPQLFHATPSHSLFRQTWYVACNPAPWARGTQSPPTCLPSISQAETLIST